MRHVTRMGLVVAALLAPSALPADDGPSPLDQSLERSLADEPADDVPLTDADPLGGVTVDMADVCEDLLSLTTAEETQETQHTIVKKLDKIIEMLEQECANCRGGGSGANPTKPLADSRIIGGPGGSGDLHGERREGRDWAQLPPKERERIMQSLTEGFPAHYQRILERYYKRLAEEVPAGSADADSEREDESSPAPAGPPGVLKGTPPGDSVPPDPSSSEASP